MKVLQINSVCGVGSTGRIATDIAGVLRQQGHDCLICYGRGDAKSYNNTYKIGNNLSVYFHVFLTRVFDKHGLGSKLATKKLIKKIREYDPDVIHLHNIHGYYLNYKVLFDFLADYDKPIVWTLHDCWAITGHCSYFDYVGCEKWKTQCYDCPQKKTYPTSNVFDSSFSNYNLKKKYFNKVRDLTIVTPSNWLASIIEKSFLQNYKCVVINNGVDTSIFKPTDSDFRERHGLQNKKIILGVANIWDDRKGYGDFIKLSEMLPDDCKIVLVGLKTEQVTKINKLYRNIIGLTKTSNTKELAEIYSAADVFFNPTYEDNYPTVNLEALCCGVPVVTYKTGGSIEPINEFNGIILEKGDYANCLMTIRELENIFNRREIVESSTKQFNNNNQFNKYSQIYETSVEK